MTTSILEQSISITTLICFQWKEADLTDMHKNIFEVICLNLADILGDDELIEELEFLTEINFIR